MSTKTRRRLRPWRPVDAEPKPTEPAAYDGKHRKPIEEPPPADQLTRHRKGAQVDQLPSLADQAAAESGPLPVRVDPTGSGPLAVFPRGSREKSVQ